MRLPPTHIDLPTAKQLSPEPGPSKERRYLGTSPTDDLTKPVAGQIRTKRSISDRARLRVKCDVTSPCGWPSHPLLSLADSVRACEWITCILSHNSVHYHHFFFTLWKKKKSLFLPLRPIISLSTLKTVQLQKCHLRTQSHWIRSLAGFFLPRYSGWSNSNWLCRFLCGAPTLVHIPCSTIIRGHFPGIKSRYIRLLPFS